jgi:hypothetical protein
MVPNVGVGSTQGQVEVRVDRGRGVWVGVKWREEKKSGNFLKTKYQKKKKKKKKKKKWEDRKVQ